MRSMKSLIAMIICMALALTGCSKGAQGEAASGDAAPEVGKINISYVKLPLNVPSIVEKKKGMFEEEFGRDGIEVSFPEITQGSKMTQAVAAGSLDFCNALGGTSAILAAANGVDIKVIGIYSRAPKAFTIMSRDAGVKSMADLRGKKVAGPKGTILHQLLIAGVNEAGISMDDVEFINMGIAEAVAAMNSGNVDAALVAGPAVTKALSDGANIVTTGEGLLDATIVIGASGKFINEHPDMVKRYMDVHSKSLDFMKENREETIEMAAQETGISMDDVEKMYEWYDFSPQISQKDIEELKKTQDFLIQNGMLEKGIDIDGMIDSSYVSN
ncbi:sulfonate transport system substrate-binding protein [Peptoclostridium litorale DSM 5388]|uniref:Putative aliphatic sulfonates-binding protein SsuA n=1 Tax=Peptoclostridium litorale DSM 5388 TaxID=1121324 RepID=A0A069RCR7_PEPLI|nr:NrtA/SsuA/CpmA family ABC transporter substrate-binding protein [Peptoclostridium litorale]KDR94854.1 putative aliphatic sulfonates-binding protein SsuA [Peptoclostridium litorale DSM 5388]SIN94165.1 sulfonate transport system substrate-binding protein [Peptoclostridium litorale DSM 5388]